MPRYAFVLGTTRSGTTALAQLLNSHPQVCIGIERYKYFVRRNKTLPESLFKEDRFFRFEPEDTNILPEQPQYTLTYSEMKEKWATAQVVGDKLGTRFLPIVLRDIPTPLIIIIIRNIHQVASSWNVRALRAAGKSSADADFKGAVQRWNQDNRAVVRLMDVLGSRMLIVEYEKFFAGDPRLISRLADFLTVGGHPSLTAAYERMTEHYRNKVESKSPTIFDGQDSFIEEHANFSDYGKLIEASRSQFGIPLTAV